MRTAVLSLGLGPPSTLIRQENRAFRKRSLNRGNLKTPALSFRVDGNYFESGGFGKRYRHDNHMIPCPSFPQTQIKSKSFDWFIGLCASFMCLASWVSVVLHSVETAHSKTIETGKAGKTVACCLPRAATTLRSVNIKHNKPNSVCELLSRSSSFMPESFKWFQDQGK